MKQGLFPKLLPHLIAFALFLIISILYCKPALDDQVVRQPDITGWKGAVQQSAEYAETHDGKYPLWTNSLFSGMPAFQIAVNNNNYIPAIAHKILTLGLPEPIQFFFLACICFYFLAIVLRVNPYIGIMGALAYAYATYNPVIIGAGHVTKMLTMAYTPALLGSLLLIFEKRYWLGAALTALFASLVIAMNHPQIAYYFFIAVAIMSIFFVVRWIRAKDYKHLAMAFGFTFIGAAIGLMTNSVNVLSTYEYQKATIRGGSSPLTDTTKGAEKVEDGLDRRYAFSYSVAIPEPLVMMVPRIYGGSSEQDVKEISDENSKALEALQSMPRELQQQLPPPLYYWGGIQDLRGFTFTSGPPYIGAIICFLAIVGLFVADRKHRWWLATATAFTIMMAWGSYFSGFNYLLFDYFPLYNKFRAPSMALVIPQLLLPILAMLTVNTFINAADKKTLVPAFKKGLIATGGVFVLLFILYFSFDYQLQSERDMLNNVRQGNANLYSSVKEYYDGISADRKSMFMGDIWRSLGFIAVAVLMLFLLIKRKVPGIAVAITLTVFVFLDLITVDSRYLNKESYQDITENEMVFAESPVDKQILADTSYYRVYSLSNNEENTTSYNYNSIGGYHAAKLRLYNDILIHRLPVEEAAIIQSIQQNNNTLGPVNTPTMNMLNTKYFLYKQADRYTGVASTVAYWPNPNALGHAWFVDSIRFVKNADEEMAAIGNIDPKRVAIVQESFKNSIPFQPQADTAATIKLVNNDNDIIHYTSSSRTNQFAVFSEVYYAAGWKALIDGKEAPIVKTNYILRGVAIPAGNHNIEFRFEPQGYIKGKKITSVATILLIALFAAAAFMEWKNRNRSKPQQPKKAEAV